MMDDNDAIDTPQKLIKWALRWAWDAEVISQAQAEQCLDWIDNLDNAPVSDLPNEQIAN